jgi:hypothetical protein
LTGGGGGAASSTNYAVNVTIGQVINPQRHLLRWGGSSSVQLLFLGLY